MGDLARRLFWSRTKRLTAVLLVTWLGINFAVPWFARDLDRWQGFGFAAGYWLVAEGTLLFNLLIVVVYVLGMDHLESRYEDDLEAQEAASRSGPA